MTVLAFPKRIYEAKSFGFTTGHGAEFYASGTLCGAVDLVTPLKGTLCLTIPEVDSLINLLRDVRKDAVENADPDDPRIVERG